MQTIIILETCGSFIVEVGDRKKIMKRGTNALAVSMREECTNFDQSMIRKSFTVENFEIFLHMSERIYF